jgi:hypothetical protein
MALSPTNELRTNGYPGPAHVVDLHSELRLTLDKFSQASAVFDRMSAAALAAETAAIGDLSGRLRSVHLAAHLDLTALLQPQQIAFYRKLRGYEKPAARTQQHHPR